jgi:radical SAM protein with 4Fe4S-binding SPASM domain
MPVDMFEAAAAQVEPLAGVVSLHVLGEPFMHPRLPEILASCSRLGLNINLVTNGTLLDKFGPAIFDEKCLRQISFSLHALAALPAERRAEHLHRLTDFASSKSSGLIVGFRLRGKKGDPFTEEAHNYLLKAFAVSAENGRWEKPRAIELRKNVFLNSGELFTWPGQGAGKKKKGCLGLRHHFAILATGEVAPCCADYDAQLVVGNINERPLAEILRSPSAAALRDSIAAKTPMPAYCSTCGFRAPGS